jgi:hypothetical protein
MRPRKDLYHLAGFSVVLTARLVLSIWHLHVFCLRVITLRYAKPKNSAEVRRDHCIQKTNAVSLHIPRETSSFLLLQVRFCQNGLFGEVAEKIATVAGVSTDTRFRQSN